MNQKERRAAWVELSKRFGKWLKMTDLELLDEAMKEYPMLERQNNLSREELIKFMVMNHVDKMV